MAAKSAGLLMHRHAASGLELLLVHPGGPFWRTKDAGAWSLPKGEIEEGEEAKAAAFREFEQELGTRPPGDAVPLGEVVQKAGKRVIGFAIEGDLDTSAIVSNAFEIEWPPRSGKVASFPEVDRAEWFSPEAARQKINSAQVTFIDRVEALVGKPSDG
jgi:predicted NUDIX family NTP pyrophosphohydrolase